jgi:hypothetical protein
LPPREQAKSAGPGVITLTEEQLERRIQSEADRREAKRKSDEAIRAKREEEIRLRTDDPFAYARMKEAQDQELEKVQAENTRLTGILSEQLTLYDRGILDHVVGALPVEERKRVLEDVTEDGITGRTKVAQKSLAALKRLWVAQGMTQARDTLLKDGPFIKEILARYGGQRQEPDPGLAQPPASSGVIATDNDAVNDWMRSAGRAIRS